MIVESCTPLDVDAYAHDISENAPELAKSSVSSRISKYSFAAPLIEDGMNTRQLILRVEYDFMIVPIVIF